MAYINHKSNEPSATLPPMEPWDGYDDMTAAEVIEQINRADDPAIHWEINRDRLFDYEAGNRNRPEILEALARSIDVFHLRHSIRG